uniref:Venom protein family 12 protein 1 n=1 Tax=Lethocerus distinctifemur TaxID=280095 RepID=A0A2K8JLD8_9HEMI|nr:venom protein family 12 protein 1 [Lethocerus distinctifemur]
MAKLLFLVVVATCIAGLIADEVKIPKDFNEFMEMTKKAMEDMNKHMNEMLPQGTEKAKEILETMRTNANQMAASVQEGVTKLHDQVKDNPELNKMVNTLQTHFNEHIEKMKSDNPELAANAEKMQEMMKATMDSLVDEVKKVEAEVKKEGGVKDTVEGMLKEVLEKAEAGYKKYVDEIHNKLGHGH